jgi:hypothetical protein
LTTFAAEDEAATGPLADELHHSRATCIVRIRFPKALGSIEK